MDAMYDGWTLRLPFTFKVVSCDSTEDAGFCRVCMNDIRLQLTENFFDFEVCWDIVNWINRPAHAVDDDDFIALVLGLVEKLAFWPNSWTCD